MATQFTTTIKPSGGDYTSIYFALGGLKNDITTADIKVFSISTYSTPTIAAGDTVLGQTSGATGVCVLVNAARTQILIKTIAVASFLSGEVVQKTTNANVNVTLSNAGDSPIIGIECYSMLDIHGFSITNTEWTTGPSNYINIYTPPSERHDGKWNTGKYRLESYSQSVISIIDSYVRIDGLQLTNTDDKQQGFGISYATISGNSEVRISNNIIRKSPNYANSIGINITYFGNGIIKIWNNIIYDFSGKGIDTTTGASTYAYNNTVYNCGTGFYNYMNTVFSIINNISYNNIINYDGLPFTNSDYNLSGPTQTNAPGANSRQGQIVTFVNELVDDFHLALTDTGAHGYGYNLYNDMHIPFQTDIDRQDRGGAGAIWDIGADKPGACSTIAIQFSVT